MKPPMCSVQLRIYVVGLKPLQPFNHSVGQVDGVMLIDALIEGSSRKVTS